MPSLKVRYSTALLKRQERGSLLRAVSCKELLTFAHLPQISEINSDWSKSVMAHPFPKCG